MHEVVAVSSKIKSLGEGALREPQRVERDAKAVDEEAKDEPLRALFDDLSLVYEGIDG